METREYISRQKVFKTDEIRTDEIARIEAMGYLFRGSARFDDITPKGNQYKGIQYFMEITPNLKHIPRAEGKWRWYQTKEGIEHWKQYLKNSKTGRAFQTINLTEDLY